MNGLFLTIGTVIVLIAVWLLRYRQKNDAIPVGAVGIVLTLSIASAPDVASWVRASAIVCLVLTIVLVLFGMSRDSSWPHYPALGLGVVTIILATLGDVSVSAGWVVAIVASALALVMFAIVIVIVRPMQEQRTSGERQRYGVLEQEPETTVLPRMNGGPYWSPDGSVPTDGYLSDQHH